MMTDTVELSELVAAAIALVGPGQRRLLGITGAPGSGKSTVAEALCAELGTRAAVVPMDGFHLAHAELERLGRVSRKGAIDTFDGAGFVALLRRLRTADEEVVYAPRFDRAVEEPIAGAIAVSRKVPLVIVEGNYLLAEQRPWGAVAPLLDQTWFVRPDETLRLERLIARHVRFGRSESDARARAAGSDQRNAELIESTSTRADRVLDVPALA